MPEARSAPKVLLSYSHDSPEHMARVLALSDRLRAEGVDSQVDQYETSPPEGWPRWTWNQVEWADFVLVICTATYDRRFRGREAKGKGHGVNWEGVVITQDLYDTAARNTKFIPVVFTEEDAAHIPVILRGATFYVLGDEEAYEALYRHLTNQPRTLKPNLGKRRPLPQRTHQTMADGAWPLPAPPVHDDQRPLSYEEERERIHTGRSTSGRKGLLILLAAVMGVVVAAGLILWRYTSTPQRGVPVQFSGRVVTENDGRPVSEAMVSVESRGVPEISQTDSQGVFSLRLNQPVEQVRVRIEAKGFEAHTELVQLPTSFKTFLLKAVVATPTPTPTPSPAPTRRPFPRPTRVPCTVQNRILGRC